MVYQIYWYWEFTMSSLLSRLESTNDHFPAAKFARKLSIQQVILSGLPATKAEILREPKHSLDCWVFLVKFCGKPQKLVKKTWFCLKMLSATFNVRTDSSLWHNRDNSVAGKLRIVASPRGKLGHGGMWKIPWIQLYFMRKQYHLIIMREQNPPPPMTNMLNGLTTRHPLWPIYWIG